MKIIDLITKNHIRPLSKYSNSNANRCLWIGFLIGSMPFM